MQHAEGPEGVPLLMAGRYWKPALILLLAGLLLIFMITSYSFLGCVLCVLAVLRLVFGLLHRLRLVAPVPVFVVRHILRGLLALLLVVAVATGIWIGSAMDGAKEPEADYVIVLGAGVRSDEPSRSLLERLRAAKTYLEANPGAVAVLSGGQGDGENLSEAQCMYNWLTAQGISTSRLRMEDRATSTQENLRFSLDLIEAETGKRPTRVAVVSNEYHLLRATLLGRKEGVEVLGWPAASTSLPYFCNMFLREIGGVWYTIIVK